MAIASVASRVLAFCLLQAAMSPPAMSQAQNTAVDAKPSPVLESEVVTTVSLRPLKAHDLLISHFDGGVRIIDGDTAKMVAEVYTSRYANFALAPDQKFLYIAESYWARGNRGPREDLLAVYDGTTLNLVSEIPLPGRLISDPKTHNFNISADGRYGYVYNFQPASSVVVVDLQKRKVIGSVETPGCGQVLPWGARGFSALCSDGTMAVAKADAQGRYSVARTAKFFDVDNDPIFDESVLDRRAGEAFLISYTGLIYPVKLGDQPVIGQPWSMQRAAGLSPATTKVGHITWRPCGSRLAAYHRASGRLFVLMHEGAHWDYAQEGNEIWVLDTKQQKLIARLEVPTSAGAVAVTQDAQPVLFAIGKEQMWVLNPQSGEVLRTAHVDASLVGVRDF
jgi:methylamine dehydrogenase heavy chain